MFCLVPHPPFRALPSPSCGVSDSSDRWPSVGDSDPGPRWSSADAARRKSARRLPFLGFADRLVSSSQQRSGLPHRRCAATWSSNRRPLKPRSAATRSDPCTPTPVSQKRGLGGVFGLARAPLHEKRHGQRTRGLAVPSAGDMVWVRPLATGAGGGSDGEVGPGGTALFSGLASSSRQFMARSRRQSARLWTSTIALGRRSPCSRHLGAVLPVQRVGAEHSTAPGLQQPPGGPPPGQRAATPRSKCASQRRRQVDAGDVSCQRSEAPDNGGGGLALHLRLRVGRHVGVDRRLSTWVSTDSF